MSGDGPRRGSAPSWLWLALPVGVGLYLRLFRLSAQVAGGDELHAVRAALKLPWWKVLVTYRASDNCIPLTFLYRVLMDAGVTLSEALLRAPILLAGLGVLILVPWWVWRRLGPGAYLTVAWLLALSPTMVHYSRIVRSYMPLVLFGFLAAVAFEDWFRTRRGSSAAAYVLCGTLAAWFHLAAAPFVLSPFLFFAAVKLLRRGWDAPSWRAGVLLGVAQTAGFSAFLVPAWPSLQRLMELKKGASSIQWSTWRGLMALQAGTAERLLIVTFWVAALCGLLLLLRRQPRLAWLSLALFVGQSVGMAILSPLGINQAPIFNRYMLVALPWVFLWVGYALAEIPLPGRERWGKALRIALAALLLAGLFASGPLLERDFRKSSFVQRAESLLFFRGRPPRPAEVPEIYRRLADGPEGAVIEYPWHPMWRYSRALVRYQNIHSRDVIVAPGEKLLWDERLAFRNMLAPKPERILESRAAYLVVHLDPESEEKALDPKRKGRSEKSRRDLERRRVELGKLGLQARKRREVLERKWGPPDHEDETIVIWNLERVRKASS